MKKLNVTLIFQSVGMSSIQVPDELTLGEAIEYAKEHLDEIPIPTESDYILDSDVIDEENCDFDGDWLCNDCGEFWHESPELEIRGCPRCGSIHQYKL